MHSSVAALIFSVFFCVNTLHASSLEFTFSHRVNGEPLLLDSLRYANAATEIHSFARVSYLLSGFALEREDGSWVEMPDQYAWIDVASHRKTFRINDIPAAKYKAIRFFVGPDSKANAADVSTFPAEHPLNPNLNSLHWSWQGGYIFLALEGLFRLKSEAPSGFSYHLARDANRIEVTLRAPISLTSNAMVFIDFDLGKLMNHPRSVSFTKDGVATHSRDGDQVSQILATNLPGSFQISRVVSGSNSETALPAKPLYLPPQYVPYRLTMSQNFPLPKLPRDNPLIEERVALGKALFHETALSKDGSLSCASCHQAAFAFSDPRRYSEGVEKRVGTRQAMPLFNLAWKSSFFWDGRATSLRDQVLVPIQDHLEMDSSLESVVSKLSQIPSYPPQFEAAFGSAEITPEKLGLALEQFLLTLLSYDSKFDRVVQGKAQLSAEEKRGFELFFTEYDPRTGQLGADCFHCHGGPLFSDHQFHNNGLEPNEDDSGRKRVTGLESDRGKFSTPSLRNVALTAPYMHDGSLDTLEKVVTHYNEGVHRTATLDPNLAKHPPEGIRLSPEDQKAIVAFLKTLSDGNLLPQGNEM
jgi:cytochrome c peroxidase